MHVIIILSVITYIAKDTYLNNCSKQHITHRNFLTVYDLSVASFFKKFSRKAFRLLFHLHRLVLGVVILHIGEISC